MILSDRVEVRPVTLFTASWHTLTGEFQHIDDLLNVARAAGLRRRWVSLLDGMATAEVFATPRQMRELERSCPVL